MKFKSRVRDRKHGPSSNLGLGHPGSVSLEEERTNTSPQGEGEIPAEARNCGGRFTFEVNALGEEFIPEPYNGDPMHIGAYVTG